ncbi:glycosyltransferase 87 family protein [Planosporangium sp. 12N6]|uniref:glycosyltransferase 87 family protein n=1 Tax=Planosporangium spinosum TaxID=3402278 RepID=UPI003CF692FF
MGTTRAGRARVGPLHLGALLVLWGAAAVAHVWYGNRHDFFDFGIYYRAVRWWADGHDLYSYSLPDPVQGELGFTYPPFAALLLRPLAALPLHTALLVFGAVSVAALVAGVWCLVAPVANRHGYPPWFGVALALPLVSWLEPVRETFTFGQVNFILFGLVVVDLLVAVPRRSRLAGVAIGLAAAIKLTPAVFVVYLLLTRRWRAAATAAATAVVATLVGAGALWRDSIRFWTELLWQTERIGHADRLENQSLQGALARMGGGEPDRLAWALLVGLVIGYGLWRARRAALAGDEVAGLTLTGLVSCVVSPVTWSHHLLWFAPALVALVDTALDRGRPRHRRWSLAAMTLVVYVTTTFAVISWYDWHVVERSADRGVAGLLIDNWYLLLMLVLLVTLPVRARPDALRPAPAPAPAEGRESTTDPALPDRPYSTPRSK